MKKIKLEETVNGTIPRDLEINDELIKNLSPDDYSFLSDSMYRAVVALRNHESENNIIELDFDERWKFVADYIKNLL